MYTVPSALESAIAHWTSSFSENTSDCSLLTADLFQVMFSDIHGESTTLIFPLLVDHDFVVNLPWQVRCRLGR